VGEEKVTVYYYGVRAQWWRNPQMAADVGARFLRMVDAMKQLDPATNNWQCLDFVALKCSPLADVRPNIAAFVERNVRQYDEDPPPPECGYRLHANSAVITRDHATSDTVGFDVTAGSHWGNSVEFEVGAISIPADLALVTYPIFRGALEAVVANWPCASASAYAVDLSTPDPGSEPKSQADLDRIFNEPYAPAPVKFLRWIGYLSAPCAAGFVPPSELISERTPGGGLILSATRDRLDPANREHLRRALMLSEIMRDRGGLEEQYAGKPGPAPRVGPY
jgi:hypothetical protein